MARRTCIREQYYTGMRRYYSAGEECRHRQAKLYVRFGFVFFDFIWIDEFVWDRAVCGARYLCCASEDPNGASGKILGPTIRLGQGPASDDEHQDFHDLSPSDKAKVTFQKQMWCADARC